MFGQSFLGLKKAGGVSCTPHPIPKPTDHNVPKAFLFFFGWLILISFFLVNSHFFFLQFFWSITHSHARGWGWGEGEGQPEIEPRTWFISLHLNCESHPAHKRVQASNWTIAMIRGHFIQWIEDIVKWFFIPFFILDIHTFICLTNKYSNNLLCKSKQYA